MESPTTPLPVLKSRKSSFWRRSNMKDGKNNPYSTRGRDKFSALLAELEEKRRKILTQNGSEDIRFIRFVYKNDTNEYVPIVVKAKKDEKEEKKTKCGGDAIDYYIKEIKTVKHDDHDHDSEKIMVKLPLQCCSEADRKEEDDRLRRSESYKKKKFPWKILWRRQPSYYLPVVVILILLLLAIYGRSFVIICISIGWYIIPAKNGSGSSNLKKKKKTTTEYVKRSSEKKMVSDGFSSPKTAKSLNNSGNLYDQSRQKYSHRKS